MDNLRLIYGNYTLRRRQKIVNPVTAASYQGAQNVADKLSNNWLFVIVIIVKISLLVSCKP